MKFFSDPPEWRKILWPLALALTIAWCSGHALPRWAQPRFEEDKLEHLLVFGLMATLLARLAIVQRTRPLGIYAAALVVSVFGLTDELHQHFTPGRVMDVYDWLTDTTGAVLATALYARWHWYRRMLETPVWLFFARRRTEAAVGSAVLIEKAA
jgi:VanZ family protein